MLSLLSAHAIYTNEEPRTRATCQALKSPPLPPLFPKAHPLSIHSAIRLKIKYKDPPHLHRFTELYAQAKKRPTVGRSKNLLWVASTTYRGSVDRPTVGFLSPLLEPSHLTTEGTALLSLRLLLSLLPPPERKKGRYDP